MNARDLRCIGSLATSHVIFVKGKNGVGREKQKGKRQTGMYYQIETGTDRDWCIEAEKNKLNRPQSTASFLQSLPITLPWFTMDLLAHSYISLQYVRHTGCNVAWIIHWSHGPINSCLTMATGLEARIAQYWLKLLSLNMIKIKNIMKLIKSKLIWLHLIHTDVNGGTADNNFMKDLLRCFIYVSICIYIHVNLNIA